MQVDVSDLQSHSRNIGADEIEEASPDEDGIDMAVELGKKRDESDTEEEYEAWGGFGKCTHHHSPGFSALI